MTEQHHRRLPLSDPPPKPASWWKSIPGQLFLVIALFAAIFIGLGLLGIVGPHATP